MNWMTWYDNLSKPGWTPSPGTIGLIWKILYPVILVSFGFVFYRAFRGRVPWIVALPFIINLVANILFMPITEACGAAAEAGVAFGWAKHETAHMPWVVYVDLPTGQVSFHARKRGDGPDYGGSWDGVKDASVTRIQGAIDGLIAGTMPPPPPRQEILDWHRDWQAQEHSRAAETPPPQKVPAFVEWANRPKKKKVYLEERQAIARTSEPAVMLGNAEAAAKEARAEADRDPEERGRRCAEQILAKATPAERGDLRTHHDVDTVLLRHGIGARFYTGHDREMYKHAWYSVFDAQ